MASSGGLAAREPRGTIIALSQPVRGETRQWSPLTLTRKAIVLWTIFIILLILWLLGMVSSYTMGGFIHILLVLAIVVVLIRVIQGRNPV